MAEDPTYVELISEICRVHGGGDPSFVSYMSDVREGLSRRAHRTFWTTLEARVPGGTVTEVVSAWRKEEIAAVYDSVIGALTPPPPHVRVFDPAKLAEVRAALADLEELESRREIAIRAPIGAGSLASADALLPDSRFVAIYAGQALNVALDHLRAWRELSTGPTIPMQAHLTLLRGALEGAARCRWHVDPNVDAGTRVGRGFAARRDDQNERRLFETSKEQPPSPPRTRGKSAIERLAELDDPDAAATREAAGVRSVGYADTTGLMIAYGFERAYRLSSALTHGKEWAFVALVSHPVIGPASTPGVSQALFSTSDDLTLAMTLVAVDAVQSALADLEAYRGRTRSA